MTKQEEALIAEFKPVTIQDDLCFDPFGHDEYIYRFQRQAELSDGRIIGEFQIFLFRPKVHFFDGFASNRPRPSCRVVGEIIKVYCVVEYRCQLCVNCPQICLSKVMHDWKKTGRRVLAHAELLSDRRIWRTATAR